MPSPDNIQSQQTQQTVEQERALAFSQALRSLLQRQRYYAPRTGTYLLPQLYDHIRQVDGAGIHVNTLRAYLRGEALPSDGKVRLLADALGVPRGVLLYAAGYLTPGDLPSYPGPHTTLESIEADIREVEALPLAGETKERILHDLRTSARILCLLHAERAQTGQRALADEREQLIEQLIDLWEMPAPPPPPLTTTEEAVRERATGAPLIEATPRDVVVPALESRSAEAPLAPPPPASVAEPVSAGQRIERSSRAPQP
ncbi:MAG: helix-turn-helix domain-containing protein [Ktedonobacterales bacterium]